MLKWVTACCIVALTACVARGGDNAEAVGEPVLERPTLRSLGAYWIVRGDDNKNGVVSLDYRKRGDTQWHAGAPLFRTEKHVNKAGGPEVPDDAWLFAGSALLLQPNSAYELKLMLNDPDGGTATKTLTTHTVREPVEARYVKFAVKSSRKMVISEVQVLDGVKSEPFDLRIALPSSTAVSAASASR